MSFIKDIFFDKKNEKDALSLGRLMLVIMFGLSIYQWTFIGLDILPNMFTIFSSLLVYVLGTKGVNEWGKIKSIRQETTSTEAHFNTDDLGD